MQNLIGIGIADATQNSRISECAFQSPVLSRECSLKCLQIAGENINAARIHIAQVFFASEHHQGSSALGACLGEYERAVVKIKSCELIAACEFRSHFAPVQAAGDHQVKHKP